MPASAPSELRSPVAVVAHDAGAANLILGWIRDRPASDFRFCVHGPAAALFAAVWPDFPRFELPEVLEGATLLLSGTSGLATRLEHDARALARARSVRSVGVVDHWVNYALRFERDGTKVLPDEIWVTDDAAEQLAQATFPQSPVYRQPNRYLEGLVREAQAVAPHGDATHVLYVLEPMRSTWGKGNEPGEFQALRYFLAHREKLGLNAGIKLRLRPHPSDPPGKYEPWLAREQVGGDLDPERSLAASIGWADWIVGAESFALVAGLSAGRRVASTLPPWAPPCRLPHQGIVKLRDLAS